MHKGKKRKHITGPWNSFVPILFLDTRKSYTKHCAIRWHEFPEEKNQIYNRKGFLKKNSPKVDKF